jgi:hypothetical protein
MFSRAVPPVATISLGRAESFWLMSFVGVETVDILCSLTFTYTYTFASTLEAGTVDAALAVLVVHGRTCSRSIRMPFVDMFAGSLPLMVPSVGTVDSSMTSIMLHNATASIGDVRILVIRPYVSMRMIMCLLILLNSFASSRSSWTSFIGTLNSYTLITFNTSASAGDGLVRAV